MTAIVGIPNLSNAEATPASSSKQIRFDFFPFECPSDVNFYIIGAGLDAYAV